MFPDPLASLLDYFWVFLIIAGVFMVFSLRQRSQRYLVEHPDLKPGYDRIFTGYLIFLNLPWVIMGIGIVFGGELGFFDFFAPPGGNLFVLAFDITIIGLWVFCVWWIFFAGGAELLASHPGSLGVSLRSATQVKITFAVWLAAVIPLLVIIWRH